MSATAVTKLAKPPMRKLFYNEAKKQLVGATIFSFAVVGGWKFFVTDVKKEKFAEFYATYDPEAEYKRLKACGVYKSIPNDDD